MGISNPFFEPLKSILVFNRRRIYIDNVYFRIHYVWTVLILLALALLITSKIYMGEPISCMGNHDIKDVVRQYCFIHSTFTRGKFEKGGWTYEPVKDNEIYPGVRPGVKGDTITFHTYYQWVWCVLVVQAIAFYIPHWIWEKLERGVTMMLIGDLNLPMLADEKKAKHRKKILLYLRRNRGHHSSYSRHYVCSEVLNFVNILFQVVLTDYFLDNEFTTYGLKIFNITQTKPYMRDDALARVFPTVTACRLSTGGVAFGKVQHDILCILPLNILNEKIYIFLWFWFLIVLGGSTLCLLYRLMTLSPRFRKYMLRKKVRERGHKERVNSVCDQSQYGEWFLIYKFSQNLDPTTFGDLIEDLDHAFRKWDSCEDDDADEIIHLKASAPYPSMNNSPVHQKTIININ